jgi:hypothetical protein
VPPDSSQQAGLDVPEVDRRIVDALNAWGPKERPLAAVCGLVEEQLAVHIAELMLQRVQAMAQAAGRRFRSVPQQGFYIDAQAYKVRITEHPTDPATIQLAIMKTGAGAGVEVASPPTPLKLALDGNGLYSTGMLYVDDDLKSIEEIIAADVQATYAAGYRWLEAHVLGELLAIEYRVAIELYMEVRSVLPPMLADAVGLYGVSKQNAFYMLDPSAIQTAFARAIEQRANVTVSPLEVTTLLVTQMLDPDETMSQVSLAEGRPVTLELENSPYAYTGLNLVENVFYNTNNLMHFPLVREGRLRVTAAYPASMNEQIAPELARITDRCAEIVHTHANFVLQRAYGQHREGYAPTLLESLARLAGWFTGGFMDSTS